MDRPRVLLLIPTNTYKAEDFLRAADRAGVEVVIGTDRHQALERAAPGGTVTLDFRRPDRAVARIADAHGAAPIRGVVASDDEAVVLAAEIAAALGLPANPPQAAAASRDKFVLRKALAARGLRTPRFRTVSADDDPREAASSSPYPCVLKPRFLNASRGVIRADDPGDFVRAFRRIGALLDRAEARDAAPADRPAEARSILVEDYLPGDEVAVEALLVDGRFVPLALFDKPDTSEGPTFEETLFVTPSRLPPATVDAVHAEAAAACRALGLVHGPVHAELRVRDGVPTLLEVAARTIGGLCARALRFGAGISLEEVVVRHAAGLPLDDLARERAASGVIMLPTPAPGVLRGVHGVDDALAIRGVVDVRVTVEIGGRIEPPPEGNRYLGFAFARGEDPGDVADALRRAARSVRFDLDAAGGAD